VAVERAEHLRLSMSARGDHRIVIRIAGHHRRHRVLREIHDESTCLDVPQVCAHSLLRETVHRAQTFVAERSRKFGEQERREDEDVLRGD